MKMKEKTGMQGTGEEVSTLGEKDYQEMCQRVVDLAQKKGATGAEVVVMGGQGLSFSFEKNGINKSSSSADFGLGIRVLKNRRIGFSYCSREEDAPGALEKALKITRVHRETDFKFPKGERPSGATLKTEDIYDPRVVSLGPEDCLGFVEDMITGALDVEPGLITSGGAYSGAEFFALANSSGASWFYEKSFLGGGISTIFKDGNQVNSASDSITLLHRELDFRKLGKETAKLTLDSRDPKKLQGKHDRILFTQDTISSLFEFITVPGVYGKKALKNESVYSGKQGELVASPELSIIDSGLLRGGMNSSPCDDEGNFSRENVIIREGRLEGFLFDGLNAAEFETVSTGNGVRAGRLMSSHSSEAPVDTGIRDFTIRGHKGTEMSFDELASEVGNGIYIHDVIGAHTANPSSGDFTISSLLLFEIKNGEIGSSLKPVNIRGNFPTLLKSFVGCSKDYRNVGGGLTASAFSMPHVALKGFAIY